MLSALVTTHLEHTLCFCGGCYSSSSFSLLSDVGRLRMLSVLVTTHLEHSLCFCGGCCSSSKDGDSSKR